MTKCTHCDATVLSSTHGVETMTITDEMVETAWSAIVGRDIAKTCFNASIIRADLKTGLTAALTAAPASWRSGATPAVDGEREAAIEECAKLVERSGLRNTTNIARKIRALLSASPPEQPATPDTVKMLVEVIDAKNARIAQLEEALGKAVLSEQPAAADVRWAVNVLLEKIAEKFEGWETLDIWRSDAAITVRGFKHELDEPAAVPEREAIIKECELAARGAIYKKIYNGCEGDNWSMDSEYGRGRHAAADAVRALSDKEIQA